MEQSFGQRRRAQHADGDSSGRFAEDGHALGIAAEGGNVFLDPLETGDHVEQTVVARYVVLSLGAQLRVHEESHLPHAVGNAYQDHALLGELLSAEGGNGRRAARESSAVDPHKNGNAIARRFRRAPDVQIQAVLARRRAAASGSHHHALYARGSELDGFLHAIPFLRRLRGAPTEVADRRRRERDASVDRQPVLDGPLHQSAFDLDRRRRLRDAESACKKCEYCNQKSSFHNGGPPSL